MNKLNDKQLNSLKNYIDERLRKRGINVITTLKQEETANGKVKLRLSSTKFNTIPVIHSEIEIVDFSSNVKLEKNKYIVEKDGKDIIKEVEQLNFWISIYASYEGNCVGIMDIKGLFNIDNDNIYIK